MQNQCNPPMTSSTCHTSPGIINQWIQMQPQLVSSAEKKRCGAQNPGAAHRERHNH